MYKAIAIIFFLAAPEAEQPPDPVRLIHQNNYITLKDCQASLPNMAKELQDHLTGQPIEKFELVCSKIDDPNERNA